MRARQRGGAGRAVAHVRRYRVLYGIAAAWAAMAVLLPTHEPASTAPLALPDVAGSGSGQTSGGVASPATVAAPGTAALPSGAAPTGHGAGVEAAGHGSAPTPAPGAGGAAVVGRSRTGVDCVPGARQIPDLAYSPPCVPAFAGDNGGATHRGVTADVIRVAVRSFPPGVADEIATAAGVGVPEDERRANEEMSDVFVEYFNEAFELYGRRVELIEYPSRYGDPLAEALGGGREGACADATDIAERLQVFGVVELAPSFAFEQCAAERQLVVFNANSFASASFYDRHHPYLWAPAMDCERTGVQLGEYVTKRLLDRPARWAGDPTLQARDRRLGVYVPDLDEYQRCVDVAAAGVRAAGADVVRFNYAPDPVRLALQADRAVAYFREQGVTTVLLACDPTSVVFLTQAAERQGYRPEWVTTGAGGGEDIAINARAYERAQVDGHLFGRSLLASDADVLGPDSEPGRLYERLTGQEAHPYGQGFYWNHHLILFTLLQAAGPNLTPAAIAAGAASLPPTTGAVGRMWFGQRADGSSGLDHTLLDDGLEVYWDADAVSYSGDRGVFVATMGGRRFGTGEWPAGEPAVGSGS